MKSPDPIDPQRYQRRIGVAQRSTAQREIINDHVCVTIDMLESLPFPRQVRRVLEYAGGHHEKMDGSGFLRGFSRDGRSIPARRAVIADTSKR